MMMEVAMMIMRIETANDFGILTEECGLSL